MKRILIACGLVVAAALPASAAGQGRPRLSVERAGGARSSVQVEFDRGYAVVRLSLLEDLGWSVSEEEGLIEVAAVGEIVISMRVDSPFFRWDGVVLQLTDAPYRAGGQTFVPLQFLTDFLPRRLPGLYDFDGARSLLRAGDLALLGDVLDVEDVSASTGSAAGSAGPEGTAVGAESPRVDMATTAEEVRSAGPSPYDGLRVVVIDAGHGGVDPGALGPSGIREKTVALGIATRLAESLRERPGLEVHMIRDDDTFVDLWERGQIATELKGERPGVFVSIHANSFPARREATGFETYFLSDARTEHERRVSAIENAPLSMGGQTVDAEQMPDIGFILRDLRNYDHAHWSSNLAALVQQEMDRFHPGPNRGVKQGVLAVLTNALMPSVLVEVGYLSNDVEGQMLGGSNFHQDAAEAIANAVVRFFERYPPGSGGGGSREDR